MNNKDWYFNNNKDIATHIRILINKLNYYTKLYDEGSPAISDQKWDDLYFELEKLEKETGIIYSNSPTQKINYEVISKLNKTSHTIPMLSLNKTKDPNVVQSFVQGQDWLGMFKMDGLTIRLTYINGNLNKAETRGNGEEGEDVTHNAFVVRNIPKIIPLKTTVVVDGEIISTFDNFEDFKDEYKNPRNFAAGSIRLLDSAECASRNLTFVAWDLVEGSEEDFFFYRLDQLDHWGFETVPRVGDAETIEDAIEALNKLEDHKIYPIDGYVFKFESVKYGKSLGRTEHHWNNALAFKFYDEEYETRLKYIDYDVSRNGILTPVAVFEPIEIDGSIVERASLHNMSIMKEILGRTPYAGEKVWVIKSNMIIPQITKADKRDYGDIIAAGGVTVGLGGDYGVLCPICGGLTSIKVSESGVETLYCENETCPGKLAQQIDHYCGKKGLDIKGISRKTIEKLIDWGWLTHISDIYFLHGHKEEWYNKTGFGKASVDKILNAIKNSMNEVDLASYISAIGIPLVGKTVAQTIAKEFSSWQEFRDYIDTDDCFFDVFDGIGEEIDNSIKNFEYYADFDEIAGMLTFKQPDIQSEEHRAVTAIKNKTFCITGKMVNYKNRDLLKDEIESLGGKVVSSISSKTDYLINNDINSQSSKNKKAKELNIPIITEEEYLLMKKDVG